MPPTSTKTRKTRARSAREPHSQIVQIDPGATDQIPDDLFSWLESVAPDVRALQVQTLRRSDEGRERWRSTGLVFETDDAQDPEILAGQVLALAAPALATEDAHRLRVEARCCEAPRRRKSPRMAIDHGQIETLATAKQRATSTSDFLELKNAARQDARAMTEIVIKSAQAVQNMTETLGASLAKVWEVQALAAQEKGAAWAKVEIAKLEAAQAESERTQTAMVQQQALKMLETYAPAIVAHVTTKDPQKTIEAMPAHTEHTNALPQSTSEHLAAIVHACSDAQRQTLQGLIGSDRYDAIMIALSSEGDPAEIDQQITDHLRALRTEFRDASPDRQQQTLRDSFALGPIALELQQLLTRLD